MALVSGMKRKLDDHLFDCSDDPTLIDDISEDDCLTPTRTSPLIYFDQGNTPPRETKKVKMTPIDDCDFVLPTKTTSTPTKPTNRIRSFNCNFKATKGLFSNVTFTLKNTGSNRSKMEEQIATIVNNPLLKHPSDESIKLNNNDIYLEIKDFISDESLSLYKDIQTNRFFDYIPQFELSGKDEQSRYIMCYLKGMIVRKTEIAVVPIPGHTHQILVFDHTNDKSYSDTPCSQQGYLLDDFEFDTKLSCIIVPKYVMVLDLDETLIRTRTPNANEAIQNQPNEYEFKVMGARYVCCVRPGTQQLLSWCCTVFQVYIFTNSIFEYATEICKILDPSRQHLLRHVDVNNPESIKTILKSREDMTPHPNVPKPLGLKDLKKFNIDNFETVIFDDDHTIWKQQECILPFADIVQYRKPLEFFKTIRLETWKKLQYLHAVKLKLRKKHEPTKSKEEFKLAIPDKPLFTLSQELALNGSANLMEKDMDFNKN